MTLGGRCAVPDGRREGVMCAKGARPGSGADKVGTVGVHRTPEGPHVGAVPPKAGIVTLTALRAHRYSEAASTSEYGMGVFSKEVFLINTGRI